MKVRDHHLRLVLTAVLPVGLLAAGLVWAIVNNERKTLQDSLADVARAISQSLDSEIRRTVTALEVLALSDRLAAGDLDAFRNEADEVAARHGGWSNVVLFRPGGERVISLQGAAEATLAAARDTTVIERTFRDMAPQISNVSTEPGSARPLVYVSVPVMRVREARYVLQATMEYPVWTEWLKRQLPDRWIAAIDDREGTIFARSERPEAFVGKRASPGVLADYARSRAGLSRARNIEGDEILAAYTTSDLTGWHVIVLTPATVLNRDANRFAAIVVAAYVAIFALGVAAALWMSRPLASGIGRLRDEIGRLGSGDLPEFRPTGIREIDEAGESIARANDLLAERAARVGVLKEELARRADAAEHANLMKDRFLGMLGHEIRNPLAAISNATTVLLMRAKGPDRELHELIARQTRHLTSLVDDLLDVSRLAQGKLKIEREPIDLAEIVARVRHAVDAEGQGARHDLHWSMQPAPIRADPVRMTQLVRNLVDNAIRYTPPGRRIDVAVGVEGDRVVLRVRDEGIGIEPALLTQVFEPFVQAPQELDRRSGGLGLGLAIARQVVELHEGTIRATSEGSGRGSTFVVELPCSAPAVRREMPSAGAAPTLRPLHVAVVEDHADARTSLRLLLERHGCTVEEALDGEQGLALLRRGRFDVAFVDLGLPVLDGFELVARLRATGSRLRMVAVSGYGQDSDRRRARTAGFDELIVKPLREEALDEVLAKSDMGAAPATRSSEDEAEPPGRAPGR